MVLSHLISNLFLIGVAVSPTLWMAVAFLFARHLLSQMDVPTRQAFLMLVVEDREREAAASLTNSSRTLAQSVSPTMAGWVMQGVALGAPLLVGAGLKIVYDVALYATIRKVQPGSTRTAPATQWASPAPGRFDDEQRMSSGAYAPVTALTASRVDDTR